MFLSLETSIGAQNCQKGAYEMFTQKKETTPRRTHPLILHNFATCRVAEEDAQKKNQSLQ